jgi:hypothetical protein
MYSSQPMADRLAVTMRNSLIDGPAGRLRWTCRPARPEINKVAAKRWRLGKRKAEATDSNDDFL